MNRFFLLIGLLSGCSHSFSQTDSASLDLRLRQIIAGKSAHVGVSIVQPDGKELLTVNGLDHYPMMSVFKFQLAVYVLHRVEAGDFSLDQTFYIKSSSLAPTFSPMRDDHKGKNFTISLRDILAYTVSKSDNNGCDFLFKLVGGTDKVNAYIHALGVLDMEIAATEAQMAQSRPAVYSNWTTPSAANRLLQVVFDKHILAAADEALLWSMMTNVTIKNRLLGELPAGTVVAHKTGTGGIYEEHLCPAFNDIGWVLLPDGRRFAISVFVRDTREPDSVNAQIIADITRAAWDYFTGTPDAAAFTPGSSVAAHFFATPAAAAILNNKRYVR